MNIEPILTATRDSLAQTFPDLRYVAVGRWALKVRPAAVKWPCAIVDFVSADYDMQKQHQYETPYRIKATYSIIVASEILSTTSKAAEHTTWQPRRIYWLTAQTLSHIRNFKPHPAASNFRIKSVAQIDMGDSIAALEILLELTVQNT